MSESKLRLLYSALDADGSGGIDEAELSAALGRRGCSQAEVSWMIKAIDSGGEQHADGVISWEEFEAAFGHMQDEKLETSSEMITWLLREWRTLGQRYAQEKGLLATPTKKSPARRATAGSGSPRAASSSASKPAAAKAAPSTELCDDCKAERAAAAAKAAAAAASPAKPMAAPGACSSPSVPSPGSRKEPLKVEHSSPSEDASPSAAAREGGGRKPTRQLSFERLGELRKSYG